MSWRPVTSGRRFVIVWTVIEETQSVYAQGTGIEDVLAPVRLGKVETVPYADRNGDLMDYAR